MTMDLTVAIASLEGGGVTPIEIIDLLGRSSWRYSIREVARAENPPFCWSNINCIPWNLSHSSKKKWILSSISIRN